MCHEKIRDAVSRFIKDLDSIDILRKETDKVAVIFEAEGSECHPCKQVFHGTQAHSYVNNYLIGCSIRKKKKLLPSPQYRFYVTDKRWRKHYTCNKENPQKHTCNHCDFVAPTRQKIQQHSKQHFLPEYHCGDCGDSWHLKTQWQQHFSYKCPHCLAVYKGEQNLKTHLRSH
jgi:hypothetical protein